VVKEHLPTADALTLDQLRDELPIMLQELAKTLESMDGAHLKGLENVSESHGHLRFHQSFNVNELMIEYGMLRAVLIDEVITHLGHGLTPEQSAALNMGIDTAVRRSVTKFTTYQTEQLKVVAEAQSKYLAFLSHDLRGGLNGVLLMVEVLKRELAGETRFSESVSDLDSMRRSILETVSTMDRFLHAERFRQGKVQPKNSTFELAPLFHELNMQFGHQAKAKGIELQMVVTPTITAVSDKELVRLILQNLLANAIKYTPTGTVKLSTNSTADDRLRISVTDTGPGIAPDRLATLFDPFTRGETHGQDGVGLGLSIAKQAADLIGAKLIAESVVGHGAMFTLEIP
jgi:signal transduction histidine kinase